MKGSKKWNCRIYEDIKEKILKIYKGNQMKNLRSQWLEKMKNWTKKTIIEEDERLNKVKIAKNKK